MGNQQPSPNVPGLQAGAMGAVHRLNVGGLSWIEFEFGPYGWGFAREVGA